MSNTIKFVCGEPSVAKHYPVVPASQAKPDWYKKTRAWVGDPHQSYPTIKKCMPVGDLISAGYMVPNPVEQELSVAPRPDTEVTGFSRQYPQGWTIQDPQEGHDHTQCPVHVDGKKKDYITFSVPWRIETPPGYSCLIMSPFYHFEDRFRLFPAIIDTDTIDVPWNNWPGAMIKDNFVLQPGEPLAQVIPIKREDWKMELEVNEEGLKRDTGLKFFLTDGYAKLFHRKKKYR
tara:strand:- start:2323 stop:3018 length:696 start_codon:yes stop_codon:yes gene_type:complete